MIGRSGQRVAVLKGFPPRVTTGALLDFRFRPAFGIADQEAGVARTGEGALCVGLGRLSPCGVSFSRTVAGLAADADFRLGAVIAARIRLIVFLEIR